MSTKLHYRNINSMTQIRQKWDFHAWVGLTFESVRRCLGILCVSFLFFCCFFLFCFVLFCRESTSTKDTWMRAISAGFMVIFSKVSFWKLPDHNYVQSSFSSIRRHIDNSILKDTLQLKILWNWIKIRHRDLNIMKQKSIKVPEKLTFTKKYAQKHLHQNRW